jgi:hypothetical protein
VTCLAAVAGMVRTVWVASVNICSKVKERSSHCQFSSVMSVVMLGCVKRAVWVASGQE